MSKFTSSRASARLVSGITATAIVIADMVGVGVFTSLGFQVIDKDAAEQSLAINPITANLLKGSEDKWTSSGGELIKLSADEKAEFTKMLSSVGADVSKTKPSLAEAYQIVSDAAARLR
jgi:hypothetical protein